MTGFHADANEGRAFGQEKNQQKEYAKEVDGYITGEARKKIDDQTRAY